MTMKKVLDCWEGCGMKIPKFHQMLHVVGDMLRFGTAKGYHGGPCESNAKTNAKEPAQNTQKHGDILNEQVSHRYCDNLLIDIVAYDMFNEPNDSKIESVVERGGTQFCIHKTKIDENWFDYKITSSTKGSNFRLSQHLLHYVADTFCTLLPDGRYKKLECFTEHKYGDNVTFHGHPCYRSRLAWNDWAVFDWEIECRIKDENGKYEHVWECKLIHGQIQFFIDVQDTNQTIDDMEPGLYAVIHSLEDDATP